MALVGSWLRWTTFSTAAQIQVHNFIYSHAYIYQASRFDFGSTWFLNIHRAHVVGLLRLRQSSKHSRNSNANTTTITNRVRARLFTKPFIFTTYNTSWNVSVPCFALLLHNERLLRWSIAWILMFRLVDVWISFLLLSFAVWIVRIVNWRVGFYDSSYYVNV